MIRRSFMLVVLAAALLSFNCGEKQATLAPGGIDVVVRSSGDGQRLGDLTLRCDDGSKTWRFALRAEGYQQRRLVLEPGRYALSFEPDVGARSESTEPWVEPPPVKPLREVHAAPGELPRWVVVAPARVTTVNVAIEVELSAPSIATAPASAPKASHEVN